MYLVSCIYQVVSCFRVRDWCMIELRRCRNVFLIWFDIKAIYQVKIGGVERNQIMYRYWGISVCNILSNSTSLKYWRLVDTVCHPVRLWLVSQRHIHLGPPEPSAVTRYIFLAQLLLLTWWSGQTDMHVLLSKCIDSQTEVHTICFVLYLDV